MKFTERLKLFAQGITIMPTKVKNVLEDAQQRTCCFTGHRSLPKGRAEQELMDKLGGLIWEAINSGYTHFVCGGAVGFDMIAAEMVLFFKYELNLDIKLEIAVPCERQDAKYSYRDKSRYKWILRHSDEIHHSRMPYQKGSYMLRNKYMVSKSSLIIAYYQEGKTGGTKNTLEYAKKLDREIWHVN